MIETEKQMLVGTVSAEGHIIRKAAIYIDSSDGMENPGSTVEVRIIADLIWVNRSDEHWSHRNNVELMLDIDIDNERFKMGGKVISIINGKEIFGKIMRVLVGSKL